MTHRPVSRVEMAAGVGIGACAVAIAAWGPGDDGTPLCPTKLLTGLDCPLCGGLRTVSSLLHLHPGRAADHNLLLAVTLPLVALWWLGRVTTPLRRRWLPHWTPARTLPTRTLPRWWGWAVAGTVLAFTVLRNLPIGGPIGWLASGTG